MKVEVKKNQTDLEILIKKVATSAGYKDSRMMNELVRLADYLNESEQEFVFSALREIKATDGRAAELLRTIWQLDFHHKPVSLDQFVEDPYYLGKPLKGGDQIYPKWREELRYVCDPNSGVVEWVVTGSIGAGKTFNALLALLYRGPYTLSCMKSPQEYFLLEENSEIVFGLFNATLGNANSVDFTRMLNFVDSCPYFKENCPRLPVKTYIYFPTKKMSFREGSSFQHVLGADLFGIAMDEANYMKEQADRPEEEQQAHQIYHHAVSRMQSRYLRFGTVPGLFCIISSKKHKTAFLERHMQENTDNPAFHVSDYALWDVRGRDAFSRTEFRVAAGNRYSKTRILDELDVATHTIISSEPDPPGQDIIRVPADWYKQFVKNPNLALRDVAGYATQAVNPLVHNVESVHSCITDQSVHPFPSESVHLSVLKPEEDLMKYIDWSRIVWIDQGANMPIFHPTEPRYVHVDLALTGDAAGIAMCCGYDKTGITEHDPISGQPIEVFVPKVHVDFMLRIVPSPGDEIDIGKITYFILNLRNFGFFLHRVTFDGFQSANAIQTIRKAGQLPQMQKSVNKRVIKLEADTQSVDKKDTAYCLLRDLMTYQCIDYYKYPPFLDEIINLEHDINKRKCDHPLGGSKDVSDAVAGAVFNVAVARNQIPPDPTLLLFGSTPEIRTDLQSQTDAGIMTDYPERKRLSAIIPSPKPEPMSGPKGRNLNGTRRGDFLSNLKKQLRKQEDL